MKPLAAAMTRASLVVVRVTRVSTSLAFLGRRRRLEDRRDLAGPLRAPVGDEGEEADGHVEERGDADRAGLPGAPEDEEDRGRRSERGAEGVDEVEGPDALADVLVLADEVRDEERKGASHQERRHEDEEKRDGER